MGTRGRNLEPAQPWPRRVTLGHPFSLPEPQRRGHTPLGQGGSFGHSFSPNPMLETRGKRDGLLCSSEPVLSRIHGRCRMEARCPAPALSTLTPPQCRSLGCSGSLPTSVWKSLAPDRLWLPPSHFSGLSSNASYSVGSSATTLPREALPN